MSLTEDLGWLKTHLVLLLLVAGLAWLGVYGVESLVARHDALAAARMDQIALQTSAQSALIQKQTADAIAQLAAQNQLLSNQVAGLQQTINNRDAALLQLQSQVKNMQPPALAAEWPKYVKQGVVTAEPDGVHLDVPAAQDTLSQLESLPVLQEDKQNLIDEGQKLSQELTNSSQQLIQERSALQSEKDAHLADNKACTADKKALKAQARKSKSKIAAIFTVVGIVAAHFLGI